MRTLGKTLQQFALLLLPIAIVLELSGGLARSFGVADLLKALIFAVLLFTTGRLVEGHATRPGSE